MTVEYLLANISSVELSEWQLVFQIRNAEKQKAQNAPRV